MPLQRSEESIITYLHKKKATTAKTEFRHPINLSAKTILNVIVTKQSIYIILYLNANHNFNQRLAENKSSRKSPAKLRCVFSMLPP